MSKKKLNSHTSEFKESSAKLAIESDQPVSQTAKELGIALSTLHTWIRKHSSPLKKPAMVQEHHFDEIKRLKKELARVTQERALQKKAAYFAK